MKRTPKRQVFRAKLNLLCVSVLLVSATSFAQMQNNGLPLAEAGRSPEAQQPYSSRTDSLSISRGGSQSPIPEDLVKVPLAPGFLISLNVLDEPDLFGNFRVDQEGNLELPVLGAVNVKGKTAGEASRAIRQKLLDERILKDPQVTVNVVEYTTPAVTIMGEVVSPGKYPLLVAHPLLDVLALAGGPNSLAGNEIEIQRVGEAQRDPELVQYSREASARDLAGIIINPGDLIRVKRAGVVYVLGAVVRPGGYVMQEDGKLDVLQALSLANGTSPVANSSVIHVLRPNHDGSVTDIPLSYNRMTKGKTAPIALQAKDVVYVPKSKFKEAFANSSAILGSVASATIYTVR